VAVQRPATNLRRPTRLNGCPRRDIAWIPRLETVLDRLTRLARGEPSLSRPRTKTKVTLATMFEKYNLRGIRAKQGFTTTDNAFSKFVEGKQFSAANRGRGEALAACAKPTGRLRGGCRRRISKARGPPYALGAGRYFPPPQKRKNSAWAASFQRPGVRLGTSTTCFWSTRRPNPNLGKKRSTDQPATTNIDVMLINAWYTKLSHYFGKTGRPTSLLLSV
jgi:hypothetical protein